MTAGASYLFAGTTCAIARGAAATAATSDAAMRLRRKRRSVVERCTGGEYRESCDKGQERHVVGSDKSGRVSRKIASIAKIAMAMPATIVASVLRSAANIHAAATRLFHKLP